MEPEILQDPKKRRDFFASAPLKAADSLQKELHIDETGYLHVAGYSHSDARAYYLYGIMDEVIKASTAIMRWTEFLDEPQDKLKEIDQKESHLNRVILESVLNEQHMWQRKLGEILSDLILFSSTNKQDYYRLYLLCQNLNTSLGQQADFQEFFACRSFNIEASVNRLCDDIDEIGNKIDLNRVWFLKKPITRKKMPPPGSIFHSVRTRFRMALEIASSEQRLALGTTYEGAHAIPSRSIHSGIGNINRETTVNHVDSSLTHVGLLSMHVVVYSYHLSEIEPKGIAAQLTHSFLGGESNAPEIMNTYQKDFGIGDIVFAYGDDLCQIIERAQSKYGYTSYKVKYLTRPPLPEVKEDWFPSQYVRLVYPKKGLREAMISLLQKHGESEEILKGFREMPEENISDSLAKMFTELEKEGILKMMLAKKIEKNKQRR